MQDGHVGHVGRVTRCVVFFAARLGDFEPYFNLSLR